MRIIKAEIQRWVTTKSDAELLELVDDLVLCRLKPHQRRMLVERLQAYEEPASAPKGLMGAVKEAFRPR